MAENTTAESEGSGPTITYDSEVADTVIEAFEHLTVDEEGFVCEDGERVTDGYNTPIRASEVGGIVDFEEHGFEITEDGFAIDEEGVRITAEYDEGNPPSQEAVVPFMTEQGVRAALLRDNFVCVCDYVNAKEGTGHRRMD